MIDSLLLQLMLVGFLGVGSQWIAWRFRLPAIVVMSIAGLLAGPVFGFMNPEQDFGDLYKPIISLAVAVILFEGSLNLDFKEVKGLGRPVMRIVTFGAFISWILGSLAAHYVAGLSWAVAFTIGGLFIVTGPTVILPLLRQAKLKPRPAKILKWEGIIVDPIGALLAVFAFEIIVFLTNNDPSALLMFFLASAFAVFLGWVCGKGVGWMFETGYIPEFLKSPAVFAVVIACFTVADEIMHETGLLSVTAMGMTLANMHISSIADMRHFKENISLLLISTIFVMLTASLTVETLFEIFNIQIIGFVALMLFVVRPLSIFLSTVGTDLSKSEKLLVGWIAPRGIVALTVASYFASVLLGEGFEDASILISLTFALVFTTVVAHGFSIGWLAKKLGLSMEGPPGVLIAGGSAFTTGLAKTLEELKIPVLLTDSSWERLSRARSRGIESYHGEILSEQTEYYLDMTPYEYLIAGTELDSYNALVCTTFVPEFGRNNSFQLSLSNRKGEGDDLEDLVHTIGGRILFEEGASWEELNARVENGYIFRKTTITEQYTFKDYMNNMDRHAMMLFAKRHSGKVEFFTPESEYKAENGDVIVSLMPPNKEFEKIQEKLEGQRKDKENNANI
ncbi:NhaP-type Na+/H+ or K+/H+ antiporter [Halobacillus karajensis]|uniref:Potassium/proton antiporter n=1 Tax=Halobacillus karajensis TaxID=195088 RepID=A0A024P3W7_9BACI|nr:sodium:proton antiporter [Halobacillus karajensis]CDQ18733.1 potassium/proton antiporter [Halobacillus karajensis]CDQ23195.1 potassium/proton antiporter [Halobacillus karajensis]CDQ26677.1 potassium/proton antiporter [Halobacillus karajensis]SEH47348.1 NhaP-type Na+/H+ or K+/H+ antiporter [Halobacillus karajensis]